MLDEAKQTQDPEGAVAACLVWQGEIVAVSSSAEDGVRHAEDLVIEIANKSGFVPDSDAILFTTLEPCCYRSPRNGVRDCTTIIINAGIRRVCFAAPDPNFSVGARERFEEAGVVVEQIGDEEIVREATDVFNGSITKPVTCMGTSRKL